MADDPRLRAFLALAQARGHPFYAYGAWVLASLHGDLASVVQALALGAGDWRPEPKIYMQTEEEPEGRIIQLRLFEEAA